MRTKKLNLKVLSYALGKASELHFFCSAQPKLTLIIEGEIPPELISEIRKLPGTRSITVY